jgi:disulfide bond formation protein DsbB
MISRYYRIGQGLLFIISISILLASCYFQYVQKLQPCPLCIMQRLCVLLTTLVALLSMLRFRYRTITVLAILQLLIASAGLYFALRQVWLQSLPADQLSVCLPGFDVLIHYFPWHSILQALIWGAADCGEIAWQWLGLSMAAWVSIYFFSLFLATFVMWQLQSRSFN